MSPVVSPLQPLYSHDNLTHIMTIVYSNSIFQQHDTGFHPECAGRLKSIDEYLARSSVVTESPSNYTYDPLDTNIVESLHSPEVVSTAEAISRNGGGNIDADTICSKKSYSVALSAAGTAVAGPMTF